MDIKVGDKLYDSLKLADGSFATRERVITKVLKSRVRCEDDTEWRISSRLSQRVHLNQAVQRRWSCTTSLAGKISGSFTAAEVDEYNANVAKNKKREADNRPCHPTGWRVPPDRGSEGTPMTASATSTARGQVLHDVFVTALEGGIGYWSQCFTYHWENGGGLDDLDLDGFYADIVDTEDGNKPYRIDRSVIERGLAAIINPPADLQAHETPSMSLRKAVAAAVATNDAGDLDADDADNIVQMGLFGSIIYG